MKRLTMKTYDDLEFEARGGVLDGVRAVMEFANGYGVSVIMGSFTYGGTRGLYELGVLKDGKLYYDTPITNDVIGHLTPADVTKIMEQVQKL